MIISRRGFLGGLLSALAAPAIVRFESIMPVATMPRPEVLDAIGIVNRPLTIDDITRVAVELWKNSNTFIQNIDRQSALPRLSLNV